MGKPGGYTVWQGTAFDCSSGIALFHGRFTSDEGAYGECNNGAIIGQSLRAENDTYTSQLNVKVSSDMIGNSIECVYDSGTSTITLGKFSVITGSYITIELLC